MKNRFFTLLFALMAISIPQHIYAILVDGINYRFNSSDKTAEVYGEWTAYGQTYHYSGDIVIPEYVTYQGENYAVTSIGFRAFAYMYDAITSVTLPSTLTSINGMAFYRCSGLTSITIPAAVDYIGGSSFDGCSALRTVTFLGTNAIYFENDAFQNCSQLQKVEIQDLPSWCRHQFRNVDSNPLYSAKHIYMNNAEITRLVIPEGITTISNYAFLNCTFVTSLSLPSTIDSIAWNSFSGCSFVKIDLADLAAFCKAETSSILRYTQRLFASGTAIRNLVIPDNVDSISAGTFAQGTMLTSVTIPNSVTYIGDNAFSGCTAIQQIKVYATTPPQIYSKTFLNINLDVPVYVPMQSLNAYQNDDLWGLMNLIGIVEDNTAIDNIYQYDKKDTKIFINGHVYILRDDKIYTVTGMEVK